MNRFTSDQFSNFLNMIDHLEKIEPFPAQVPIREGSYDDIDDSLSKFFEEYREDFDAIKILVDRLKDKAWSTVPNCVSGEDVLAYVQTKIEEMIAETLVIA